MVPPENPLTPSATPPVAGPGPFSWVREHAVKREADGLRRRLRPRTAGAGGLLELAGNDYLGLARHPAVTAAAAAATARWGAGATGSRLVTGSTELHAQLEAELARFFGTEAALVFSSGYLANVGALGALAGPGDLVVSDALNHASIIDGVRLARARVVVVPHRDVGAVAAALAGRAEERAVVVTDAVFSVDGDLAPLADLVATARRYRAGLIVDEAHAFGVLGRGGRGALDAAGLAGSADVVVTATLSKALGSQGGAVLASRDVVEHIVDAGRTFIFDTGLAPGAAGAARAALEILAARPKLATLVRSRAIELAGLAADAGLVATDPAAAVTSILIGPPDRAIAAAGCCAEHGIWVGCFRPPSVPDGVSRLRVTARADLTDADLDRAAAAFRAVAALLAGDS
ncbi:MAG TPA: 8-amino-7-oxononanoate synthase [Actinomycetes bacterium]|nr:8-amino-7-oxononanoate synthase [Actinomycetes bacterium]